MATADINVVSQDTKARIIEAAGQVFANKGFEAATVREICQLAHVNLAAINYHFGDKQRLYVEAVKRAHLWRVEQAAMPQWGPETTAETKLADFIRTMLLRLLAADASSWHTALMMREMSHPNSACEELVAESIRPMFLVLQGILAELVPAEVSEVKRHQIAFSIVGQCLYYRLADPVVRLLVSADEYASYTADTLAAHIRNWTLASLGLRPALNQPGGLP
jgi:AcrR family transcriptional regulator